MMESKPPVRLAGSNLQRGRGHVCALFHGRDELYEVILPFLKEGFERGDKLIHITDPDFGPDHERRLGEAGIHGGGGTQVTTLSWQEAHQHNGRFDQHAMLAWVDDVLAASKREGFATTRLTANMEWALEDLPGGADLIEYEARANHVLPKYNDAVV